MSFDSRREIWTNQMDWNAKSKGQIEITIYVTAVTTKQFIILFFCFVRLLSLTLSRFLLSFFFALVHSHCFVSRFFYCFVLWLRHITMCIVQATVFRLLLYFIYRLYVFFSSSHSFVHSSFSHPIVICREVAIFTVKIVVYTLTCSIIFLCLFVWIALHPFSSSIIIFFFKQRLNAKLLHLHGETVKQSKSHIRRYIKWGKVWHIKG